MKKVYLITIACTMIMVLLAHGFVSVKSNLSKEKDHIKVGFVYVGDSCDTYTYNFIRAQKAIEAEFGQAVEVDAKYNVEEGQETKYLQELVDDGCDLIFTTSYGYGNTAKEFAAKYPDIEFCQATCDNANTGEILPNYHNFMGEIYQGRYVAGVVAGMKLRELIDGGIISEEQAKIGYIGAFPYAEVISGYTAFYLGVKSVAPEASMIVTYANSWGDYDLDKQATIKLLEKGCVIISQHSDTAGPAIACQELSDKYISYHVGYNQSVADLAPTAALISSRINWQYYMVEATSAVLRGKRIESVVQGNVHGNDIGGGFKEQWVQMLKLNEMVAAEGTADRVRQLIKGFERGEIHVFKGDYKGVDPYNSEDVIDLNTEFYENAEGSAPTFHYVLEGIEIIELDELLGN